LSEEFGGALVSEIIAEQQRLPIGFLEQVLEYRSAAAARAANQADPKGWSSSPMRVLMQEIETALAMEAFEAHG
jgi:hypothetical protein